MNHGRLEAKNKKPRLDRNDSKPILHFTISFRHGTSITNRDELCRAVD